MPTREETPGCRFRRCGDTGLLMEMDDNEHVHAFAQAVTSAGLPGIIDVIPALQTVLILIDPDLTEIDLVARQVAAVPVTQVETAEVTEIVIPVTYDGVDLAFVAEHTGLDEAEVIRAHTESQWRAAFCGFAPGFAYLVGGDPRLEVPRRGEPRVRVPPGSVALAGRFASVYPRESPGGWQLIGHTDLPLWDTDRDPPALLMPGTKVRFCATEDS